jgi:ATP-dependent Clp protease ATP-binding subunit ClpX
MAGRSSPDVACSFCGRSRREADKLVAGPRVYICSLCIRLCADILKGGDDALTARWGGRGLPRPADIKKHLDQYVVGQERAKRQLAVAVYNHYKRVGVGSGGQRRESRDQSLAQVEVDKSNVLLLGPTGTGKTLLAQTLARMLDVPFHVADSTSLTEAGYVGEDVESIIEGLLRVAGGSVERAERGIVYLDEIDKLSRKGATASVTRDVGGEGVQQGLLKLVEGTKCRIHTKGGERNQNKDTTIVDTSKVLFICGGAFEGLVPIIKRRLGKRSVGFAGVDAATAKLDDTQLLGQVTPEDLFQFGMIPELVGRLPIVATLEPLDEDALVRVLAEPKNSVVRQYQKLFKLDGIQLQFADDALRAAARRCTELGMGARSLRSVVEECLLDLMFELPSREDVRRVTVTGATIRGEAGPEIGYRAETG